MPVGRRSAGALGQEPHAGLVTGRDLPAVADDPVRRGGEPRTAQRLPEAAQPLRGCDVVEAADQGDAPVARLQQHRGRRPPAGPLGRDHRRQRAVLGQAVRQHRPRAAQPRRDGHATQGHRRVDDAVHPAVQQLGDRGGLLVGIAAGVHREHQVVPVPSGLHGTAQQLPRERRGGDLVGHQPDHGRPVAAQPARDGVGPVAQLRGRGQDPLLGPLGQVALALLLKTKGDLLLDRLRAENVGLDLVQRGPEPTALAVASFDRAGSAAYTFYVEGTADRLFRAPSHLPAAARALMPGSCSLALEPGATAYESLMRDAAARGVLVAPDPNIRPGLITDAETYRARFRSWLRYVDLVKVSEEDMRWLGGDPGDWLAANPAAVVVTRGAEGLTVFTRCREPVDVPGEPVDVVDTIGAGDTVYAALVHALAERNLLTGAACSASPPAPRPSPAPAPAPTPSLDRTARPRARLTNMPSIAASGRGRRSRQVAGESVVLALGRALPLVTVLRTAPTVVGSPPGPEWNRSPSPTPPRSS